MGGSQTKAKGHRAPKGDFKTQAPPGYSAPSADAGQRQHLADAGQGGHYGSTNRNDPFVWQDGAYAFSDKPYYRTNQASSDTNALLQQQRFDQPTTFKGQLASAAVLVLMPWLMFVLISCLFMFQYQYFPVVTWLCVFICSLYGFVLVWERTRPIGRHRFWLSLGLLCLLAVFTSALMGFANYSKNVMPYWIYSESRHYTNVLATESAGAKADAGMITFSIDSHIDPTRAVGYKSGNTFCVAPILGDNAINGQTSVGYWAAGIDCCAPRGQFYCDEAWDKQARSGLVLKDIGVTGHDDPMLPEFQKAAEAAAAAYDLALSPTPIFVRWVSNVEGVHQAYWDDAVSTLLMECLAVYLPWSIVSGIVCHLLSRPPPTTTGGGFGGWAPSKSFVA